MVKDGKLQPVYLQYVCWRFSCVSRLVHKLHVLGSWHGIGECIIYSSIEMFFLYVFENGYTIEKIFSYIFNPLIWYTTVSYGNYIYFVIVESLYMHNMNPLSRWWEYRLWNKTKMSILKIKTNQWNVLRVFNAYCLLLDIRCNLPCEQLSGYSITLTNVSMASFLSF